MVQTARSAQRVGRYDTLHEARPAGKVVCGTNGGGDHPGQRTTPGDQQVRATRSHGRRRGKARRQVDVRKQLAFSPAARLLAKPPDPRVIHNWDSIHRQALPTCSRASPRSSRLTLRPLRARVAVSIRGWRLSCRTVCGCCAP
jgi:hypothetical protein